MVNGKAQTVVSQYNGTLFRSEKEKTTDTYYSMDASQRHCIK